MSLSLVLLMAAAWQDPKVVGYVDADVLPEASGIAASAVYPDRLYHINDSGNAAAFVISSKHGGALQTVRLQGVSTRDTEDLSIGRCPDQGSCLYIADTGDNEADRDDIAIYVIRERDSYPASIPVDFTLKLEFPDGAHNVESLAIHPSGKAFLLTKEEPAQFYEMDIPKMKAGATTTAALQHKTSLRLGDYLNKAKVPTSMAIRADGKQLAILCKAGALALDWDLANEDAPRKVTVLPFMAVPQAEAITYMDKGLLYSTESDKSLKRIPLTFIDQK